MADKIGESVVDTAKKHPYLTLGGVAVVGLALYMIYKNNASSSTNQSTNQGQYYVAFVDEGAPFSAGGAGSTGTPGTGPLPPGPPLQGGNPPVQSPTNSAWTPLLNTWPSNFPKWEFGNVVTINGTKYTIGPGGNQRVWGVPNFKGTLDQWNNIPIAPGQKQLLYQGGNFSGR